MTRTFLACLTVISCWLGPAHAQSAKTEAGYRALPNLVSNASFEMDWMHNRVTVNTRFLLLEQSDWGYAQADGRPDYWIVSDSARLDSSVAKFGKKSLQLQGTASQIVYLLGETDPRDGGAFYNAFRPLPAQLLASVKPRPLRFGAWCKTDEAKVSPTLAIVVEHGIEGKMTSESHTVSFAKGTHDWEYQEIIIPIQQQLSPTHAARVHLAYQGEGKCWFDGVFGAETATDDEPNLLPNGGFETLEKDWPADWSPPVLWSWARRNYYRFTGWSHKKGNMAGGAVVAPLGHDGGHSLQFTLPPGDNFAVKSGPIELKQTGPRVLEVSAWIKAEDLRWLEIMAQDEEGQWLPQQDFAGCMGTDDQYRNRVMGIGSHDWEFVRKHFVPSRPVRSLTLWLCARGMDGKQMARNVVGTVWFDDVILRERGTPRAELAKRGVTIPPASKPSPGVLPYRIRALDMGERLWGLNELKLTVENPSAQAIEIDPGLELAGPAAQSFTAPARPITVAAKVRKDIAIPYRLTDLPADWQQHFRFAKPWSLSFGAPSSPITLRLADSYIYPDEMLEVGVNLNITQASLKDVAVCRLILRHPGGVKVLREIKDITGAIASIEQNPPKLLKDGHVDARNLLSVTVPAKVFPAHPHSHPVRDCRVVAMLLDAQGKVIAEQVSEPFGFLERPAPSILPQKIERTEVVEGGTLLVNGKPYILNCFPFAPTDLGNVDRTLNFPKTHKILALPYPKLLVFGPADEASWKQKIQAFVRFKKNDPALFGYYFAHDGETTFWMKNWREMATCQRKVAGWVREVDPNHVIMSASWLFGHGALNPVDAKHFDFLDVIDVEPGLTWSPDSHAVREAAGRPVAIVAGLECYYFQSTELLRWRTYEALRLGANGIGICPSGMLQAKPEIVSFLRGLHGEVQGLEPLLTGRTPTAPSRSNNADVTFWERQAGKTRYLVAMIGKTPPGRRVTFTLPQRASKVHVMFEGRTIPADEQGFADLFDNPYAVHVYRIDS